MADDRDEVGGDTERRDVLMMLLHELRELRKEQSKRDEELDRRIENLERIVSELRAEVELVSNELQRQGKAVEDLSRQCCKRLEICRLSRRDSQTPQPSPVPTSPGSVR